MRRFAQAGRYPCRPSYRFRFPSVVQCITVRTLRLGDGAAGSSFHSIQLRIGTIHVANHGPTFSGPFLPCSGERLRYPW